MKNFIESSLIYNKDETIDYFSKKLKSFAQPTIDYGFYEEEFFSNNWGIEVFYLKMLQGSQLDNDPRSIIKAKCELSGYLEKSPSPLIEWEELVQKQWIRIVWDRWYLPREVRMGNVEMEPHLKEFCEVLNQLPYPDERDIVITNFQQYLSRHQSYYPNTPKYEDLIEKEIVIEKGQQHTLNLSHAFFKASANKVFADLWKETDYGPSNSQKRLIWWMDYFELSRGYGNNFLDYLSEKDRDSFIEAVWERIVSEPDLFGWQNEYLRRFAEEYPFSTSETVEDLSKASFPEQLSWILDDDREHLMTVHDPRERVSWLFSWLIKSEFKNNFVYSKTSRLDSLLQKAEDAPYFVYEIYHVVTRYKPEWIPLMLSSPKHLDWGMILLSSFVPTLNIIEKEEEETLKKEWWDIGLAFISHTFKQLDPKEASMKLLNIAKWLFQEKQEAQSSFGRNELQIKLSNYRYSSFFKMIEDLSYAGSQEQFVSCIIPEIFPVLMAKIDDIEFPLLSCEYYLMMWVITNCSKMSSEEAEKINAQQILKDGVPILQKGYIKSLTNPKQKQKFHLEENNLEWNYFANQLFQMNRILYSQFITCFHQFNQSDTIDFIYKLRMHLQLMCNWITNWKNIGGEEGLSDLVSVLEQLLEYQHEDSKSGSVDIFSPIHEMFGNHRGQEQLYKKATSVLNYLPEKLRERLIQQFLKVTTDSGRLSILIQEVSDTEEFFNQIIDRIQNSSIEKTSILEAKQTIASFIESQQPSLISKAFDLLTEYDELANQRHIRDWIDWSFSIRLKGLFLAKDNEAILNMKIPERILYLEAAKSRLQFYQGLVFLSNRTKEDIGKAINIFSDLQKQYPNNISFAINYYAARVGYSAVGINKELNVEKAKELRKVLAIGESIRKNFSTEQWFEVNITYSENQLFLFLLLNDWTNFWSLYWSLSEEVRHSVVIGSYAIHAYMKQGEDAKAHELLEILREKHGEIDSLQELQKDILIPQHFSDTSSAIFRLQNSTPKDQVKLITGNQSAKLDQFLIGRIADACRTVCNLLPTLTTGVLGALDEDRYTDLFLSLFEEKVRILRWTMKGQDRGGYTAIESHNGHGGVGERDGILYGPTGSPLALIEALVLKHVDTQNIKTHTEKIFGYDTTGINLHFIINWGTSSNHTHTWEGYKKIVAERQEGIFAVEEVGDIGDLCQSDDIQGIDAFYTVHNTTKEDVKANVIHFYVDVKQDAQKMIAKQSRRSKN
ncbi:hypothetical protein ABEY96_25465 [Priestia aryabhattai]|uniref:hypothetical protein n=1 Tax=Priestia aryabhattai TaxID=412384 RepID=UPI003D29F89A